MKKALGKLSVAVYTHKLWFIGTFVWLLLMIPLSIYIVTNIEDEGLQKVTSVTDQKAPESRNPQDTTPKTIDPALNNQEATQPTTQNTQQQRPSAAEIEQSRKAAAAYSAEAAEIDRCLKVNSQAWTVYENILKTETTKRDTDIADFREGRDMGAITLAEYNEAMDLIEWRYNSTTKAAEEAYTTTIVNQNCEPHVSF